MSGPIADLSYRNYDGPLEPPMYRWWAIARVGILRAFGNKWFWVLSVLGGFWYVILMIMFYFVNTFPTNFGPRGQGNPLANPAELAGSIFKDVNWREPFLQAFSRGHLWFFLIALLIGVGTIANDNRANALLVYLSKPCTKVDYIVGKWVGIFVPMAVAVAVPALFFYGYCFMSYRQYGFLDDPWLFFRILLIVLIPATFHASLSLGVSSLFKQGRVAGATYAGLYFFTLFFTKLMEGIHVMLVRGDGSNSLVDNLFYFSVDGIQIGLAKDVLGTNGGQILPIGGPLTNFDKLVVHAPNVGVMLLAFVTISGLFLLLAASRVRAVEIVR